MIGIAERPLYLNKKTSLYHGTISFLNKCRIQVTVNGDTQRGKVDTVEERGGAERASGTGGDDCLRGIAYVYLICITLYYLLSRFDPLMPPRLEGLMKSSICDTSFYVCVHVHTRTSSG